MRKKNPPKASPQRNLEELILAKIKKNAIKPIPRWKFILLNVALWSLVVLAILFGSLALGVVLDILFGADWGILDHMAQGRFSGFLLVLPYLWILVLVFTGTLAWKVFPHTRKGYRYTPRKILLMILIFSVAGGAVLWQTRVSHRADRWTLETLPPEMQFEQGLKNRFFSPELGVLDGFIVEENIDEVLLRDLFGEDWTVDITQIDQMPTEDHVLFFGEQTGEFTFEAERVLTPRGFLPEEFRPKKMKDFLEEVRIRE